MNTTQVLLTICASVSVFACRTATPKASSEFEAQAADSEESSLGDMTFVKVGNTDLYVATTEVTRGQWKELFNLSVGRLVPLYEYQDGYDKQSCTPTVKKDNHPVTCITTLEADQFMQQLTILKADGCSYFVPTEQQWHAAASFAVGDYDNKKKDVGRSAGNSGNTTHPVKSMGAVGGLFDMVGNVREGTSTTGTTTKIKSATGEWIEVPSNKVVRGGGYSTNDYDCSTKSRFDNMWGPKARYSSVGIRVFKQCPAESN